MDIESLCVPLPKDGEWFAFPLVPEFRVKVRMVTDEDRNETTLSCVKEERDPATLTSRRVRDEKAYFEGLIDRTIVGWEGLTVGTLKKLLPATIQAQTEEALAKTVDCTRANKITLFRKIDVFANWINGIVRSQEDYLRSLQEREQKNS